MTAYLDHAASTPIRPEALQAYTEAALACGNSSSVHSAGRRSRRLLEESRERLARAIGANPFEVVFTSGGTESDNLALKGIYRGRRGADPECRRILLSRVEHHAVLDAAEWLAEHEGAELVWLAVDAAGRVHPGEVAAALAQAPQRTALVSAMWANNEVGSISAIADIVAVAHEAAVPVHTDAVQAVGSVPVDVNACGVDALSLSGHKFGGPLGVGALVARRGLPLVPLLQGGGQEQGQRSGTVNVPGAVGLSVAAEVAVAALEDQSVRIAALRDLLLTGILARVPDAVVAGAPVGEGRLPGNAHVRFPGCEGDSLLYLLDAAGVECSTGSACQAGVPQPSHVLTAMGVPAESAHGALRFSLGHTSTEADVRQVLAVIGDVVERARTAGLASVGGGS
ncbi:MAG: cysteine desulfurase family protein [Actinomycetales bacterium]